MALIDPMVERIEASFKELVHDVNATSAAARAGWVFYLILLGYFFLALSGISHRDLLLDAPVTLPVIQAEVSLRGFFIFAPLLPLLVHFGILTQHVQLARQCQELHRRAAIFEGAGPFRAHRARLHLSSYFFTQLIAGPQRGGLLAFLMALLAWLTFAVAPILLLLAFQTGFLPYHDLEATWLHRAYLVVDVMLVAIFAVFMRYPSLGFVRGFGRTLVDRPFSFLAGLILLVGAMFFSLSVATIPDEHMDRVMTTLMPEPVPGEEGGPAEPRLGFLPTVFLFERGADAMSGRPLGFFSRNLIVTDADLARESSAGPGATGGRINLRRRDLRYAVLDRSNLSRADLTGAVLSRASLRETDLTGARADQAVLRGADMRGARLVAQLGADLRGANLSGVNLQGVDLESALLEGADLSGAQMDTAAAARAGQQGARF